MLNNINKAGALQGDGSSAKWNRSSSLEELLFKTPGKNVSKIPKEVEQQLQQIISPHKIDEMKITSYNKIKLGTRSYYSYKHQSQRHDSSWILYKLDKQLSTCYIGRITSFLHIETLNIWLVCVRRVTNYKDGQLIYSALVSDHYDLVNISAIQDQMIYCSATQQLTEASAEYFTVQNRYIEYPNNEEEVELMEYLREKYKKRFGTLHEH